jgi:hypothetical protein
MTLRTATIHSYHDCKAGPDGTGTTFTVVRSGVLG